MGSAIPLANKKTVASGASVFLWKLVQGRWISLCDDRSDSEGTENHECSKIKKKS